MLQGLEVVSKVVGIIIAFFLAALAIWQAIQSLKHRRVDLRWKQSEMAKRVVDEWFNTDLSRDALQMIMGRKRRYVTAGNGTEVIPHPYVLKALRSREDSNSPQEIFIQDCFDRLFYFFDRTEQLLTSGLILFEDVQPSTYHYAAKITDNWDTYSQYAELKGFSGAISFLDRFNPLRQP